MREDTPDYDDEVELLREAMPEGSVLVTVLFQSIVVFTFLVFAGTCNAIFSVFQCTKMADNRFHLVGDLDVICWQGGHIPYVGFAICMCAVYPAGVPIFLLTALRRAKQKGILFEMVEDEDDKERRAKMLLSQRVNVQVKMIKQPHREMKHLASMYKKCVPRSQAPSLLAPPPPVLA